MFVEEIVFKLLRTPKNSSVKLLYVIYFSTVVIRCFMTTFLVHNYECKELYTVSSPTKYS